MENRKPASPPHHGHHLQRLPAPCLDRQDDHADESGEEQRAGGVDWRGRVGGARVASDDGRAETRQTVQEARDAGSSAAHGRGEDFRRVYDGEWLALLQP